MRRALVLSFSNLRTDPRVGRQLALLARDFDVTAVAFHCPDGFPICCHTVPDRHWKGLGKIRAAAQLGSGRFESAYWSSHCVSAARALLRASAYDLIVANDIWTLPLALDIKGRAKVLFDAHEYAPREFENRLVWRLFFQGFNDYLCRQYLPKVGGMTTVCQSIADEYRAIYGVSSEVVMNAPPFQDLKPGSSDADTVRMVHHGGAIPSRRIELMIEAMEHLDCRFHLDLMLVPTDARYLERLREVASRYPRVRLAPTVPMPDLPRHLNRYDIGLFLLPPTNYNYCYALPNKLFEFVQARLAIAIGPSPEMARLVQQYDCGVVSDNFSPRSLAQCLNGLDRARIDHYKQRSHVAATELCFEKNSTVLINMIDRLMGRP